MKILELFSGTESFSKVARERGHEVFTVDIEPKFNPSLCIDIMQLTPEMILERFGKPDFIWASPPCTTFSVASIYRYWENGKPKNEKTLQGIAIVKKTIELIEALKPTYFVIENPRGMLRKQDFMQHLKRDTVTYCQYGAQWQKATDLWNNLEWNPKPICSPNAPCHIRAPRGSKTGIQGVTQKKYRQGTHPDGRYTISRSPELRAVIPSELCKEILNSIEAQIISNSVSETTQENQ